MTEGVAVGFVVGGDVTMMVSVGARLGRDVEGNWLDRPLLAEGLRAGVGKGLVGNGKGDATGFGATAAGKSGCRAGRGVVVKQVVVQQLTG